MDDGLLIAPARVTSGERLKMAFQAQYAPGLLRRKGTARIQDLARTVAGDPKSYAGERRQGAIWVPYSEVTGARFTASPAARAGLLARTLTLDWPGTGRSTSRSTSRSRSRSGDTIGIRWTAFSVELGEVQELLARALDV
jgi:hypothetical protein